MLDPFTINPYSSNIRDTGITSQPSKFKNVLKEIASKQKPRNNRVQVEFEEPKAPNLFADIKTSKTLWSNA